MFEPINPAPTVMRYLDIIHFSLMESDDRSYGLKAVNPGDLFPFTVCPALITDSDLINPAFCFGDFGGNLRFKTKSPAFQRNGFKDIAPECLVTRFDIREIQICKHVA